MPRLNCIALAALLWCASLLAGQPELTAAAPDGETLAWLRFEDEKQKYADLPYHFLGDGELKLTIDVKPATGQTLALHWGSKNDVRSARLVLGEKSIPLSGGGYNGFRWLMVPLPELNAEKYELTLAAGDDKPGFIAEVRLIQPGKSVASSDMKAPSSKITRVAATLAPNPVEPSCVTPQQSNDQLVYFTSTSLLEDDKRLVFISDRTGHPNLFMRNMDTGEERQLTSNAEGYMKSYVYFDGQPYKGLGRASVSVDPHSGTIYFLQGRQIRAVSLDGKERMLAEYPEGQMTAFTHVSADGTRLCVPTTDAAALDGPPGKTDARVQEQNLSSYLRVYDTQSGKEVLCERVQNAWITHVQFSPIDRNLILYNHEWPSDCGIRRMWLWDGKTHLRLRTEGDGRSRADWTCHEMWERDGKAIVYHGGYNKGPTYVGRVNSDGTGMVEIALPAGWHRYGHFTVGKPGWLVSDGYYQQPGDTSKGCGAWISLIKADWQQKRLDWIPLCRNGSSWSSQDAHPHPIFNHAADAVFFTSDLTGKRAVYKVAVP
ncbi:MAG TPA: oligogalacturonate lyase family protein [Planctomycetota bacterium]|jgi:hypothetical protein